ncbi:M14 family zinc carboxypeptidase [Roseateles amylovorans]|uniref:M14 family zinc carboxypeptidase n=1 Tax=Roseateles amylovorans TaxID=2978473 RepID=A0ABY6B5H2_9BURK|nr:M14 family zinc carboxypeptidase [Roseateles amylovorans]UXH80425.1 M14 family zinc carboxypeptidase [Roseateles amylovorans]
MAVLPSSSASSAAVLPELQELARLIDQGGDWLRCRELAKVRLGDAELPVMAITMGNPDPSVPGLGFIGGVHGLERIGAQVVLGYLGSLVRRLRWDASLHQQLESLRLVFLPLVNPGGILAGTRSNPQGVDLMRNAPQDAERAVPFLVGGQRLTSWLPWYRGASGAAMEPESEALCRLVREELLGRPFSLTIDCHSGFGLHDRIWFPYARSRRPMRHLAEVHALCEVLDQGLLAHPYVMEPQSRHYLAHGDLWDHLYDESLTMNEGIFLPMTLEMGSWRWVKKNPRQLLSRHGMFNPLIEHRQQRVLRRHMAWMDFMTRATQSAARWLPGPDTRLDHGEQALFRWYRRSRG